MPKMGYEAVHVIQTHACMKIKSIPTQAVKCVQGMIHDLIIWA